MARLLPFLPRCAVVAGWLCAASISIGRAQTEYTWIGTTGDGTASGNWSPAGGPPGGHDTAYFSGSTATADLSTFPNAVDGLIFDSSAQSYSIYLNGAAIYDGGITNNSSAPQSLNASGGAGASQTWTTAAGGSTLIGANLVLFNDPTVTVDGAGSTSVSGILSGSGAIIKNGAGTLSLSNANTFSGTTTVNAGVLNLTGSAASSNFTVNSGGNLTSSGTVGGFNLNGGTLSFGSTPGTLTTGAATLSGGSTIRWQINNATGMAGTNWGLLAINGGLTMAATADNKLTISLQGLNLGGGAGVPANFDPNSNYHFLLAQTTGGVSGFSAADFTIDTSGFGESTSGVWSVEPDGNNLDLDYTGNMSAVPEPAEYSLLAGLGALTAAGALALSRRPGSPSGRVLGDIEG